MASFDDRGIQSFRAFIASIQSATHAAMTATAGNQIESEDAFDEMRQHVLDLYQGVEARHSFLLEDGQQVVDCIPIDQQPAMRRFGGPVREPPPLPEGFPRVGLYFAPRAAVRQKVCPIVAGGPLSLPVWLLTPYQNRSKIA